MEIEYKDYQAECKKRGNREDLRFKCPICGGTQSIKDFRKLGLEEDKIDNIFYFSCIGRWNEDKNLDGKKCNYTSGGLFKMNKVFVNFEGEKIGVFDFADNPLYKEAPSENSKKIN